MQKGIVEDRPTARRRRPYTGGPREETSLLGFVNVVLRHRRVITLCALAGGAILGASSLNSRRLFAAYSSFTIRGTRPPSQLSAVAARLGITVGGLDESESLAFYGDLVRSRSILGPVSRKLYSSSVAGGNERPLTWFFGIHEKDSALAASRALDELNTRVAVSPTPRTGIITVRVRAEQRQLAQQILQNILAELDSYNLATRRKRAAAERQFVERRLADASAALMQTESQLSSFLQMNRDYSSSPVLRMENDRLQRAVRMRQQIYTAMAQSLEQAKIEEIRELPTVLIIDPPESGLTREPPVALRRTLLGLIAGLFVGIVLAFLRERAEETREADTSAYTQYTALKSQALGDLRRPWAPVGRLLKGQPRA